MKVLLFIAICIVVAVAMPYGITEDEYGQQYYAVPIGKPKSWVLSLSRV